MTHRPFHRIAAAGLAAAAALSSGACSEPSDKRADATSGVGTTTSQAAGSPTPAGPATTASTAPGRSPTTAPTPAAPDRSAEALAFFKSTAASCTDVDPKRYSGARVTGRRSGDRYDIRDGAGTSLVVDLGRRVVTGPGGPQGVMPREYSFACPPELYEGTMDEAN